MSRSRDRFLRSLNRWWSRQLAADPDDWRRGRSVDALAHELRRDVQFEMSQAAFLHRRPDGETSKALVAELVPPPSAEDAEVLAEAIVRAGSTAQKVRVTTAAGALLTVLALVVRNVLRGR